MATMSKGWVLRQYDPSPAHCEASSCNNLRLLLGFGVVVGPSRHQAYNKGAEQGLSTSACVVHEPEEAERERQLVLRDAPTRAKPGAQQGPKTLDGIDVDLAEAVTVLVAGILAAPMADRLVPVAPGWQARMDATLVRVDEGARGDSSGVSAQPGEEVACPRKVCWIAW